MINQVLYKPGQTVPVKMWNKTVPMEGEVYDQLERMASLPFIFKHIAVMPDAHVGRGSTVGSVIPTHGAIIPAAVGVDIGCGMVAVRLSLKANHLPDDLTPLYNNLCRDIPVGQNEHKQAQKTFKSLHDRLLEIDKKHPKILGKSLNSKSSWSKWPKQLGSLGGGNHFIEICLDENQDVWLMLHSGSRNIGNVIGTYFISLAKEEMKTHFITLLDQDLSYLSEGTQYFNDYVEALTWAQDYARTNRQEMVEIALKTIARYLPPFVITTEVINCHHNYVERENHFGRNILVTRKGAIRARSGDMGIIPGSMGTKSYIVEGLGNEESFHSSSHGAGRVYSRTKAKVNITLAEHEQATEGVMCRKDAGVLDESPGAYKDIDQVMESQKDLVKIVHTLKQVLCIKG